MVTHPVDYIIFIFGGPSLVAKALGITHAAVCQWKTRQQIPTKRCSQILEIARMRGLDISPKDLIEGRELK